jgi:FkbM family methyltransferase
MNIGYSLLRIIGHQDWLRFGIRSRLIRFFITPGCKANHEFKVDYFGFLYTGNLNNLVDWYVYFFAALEKGLLFFMKELAQKEKGEAVFLDIGANVGTHSIFMSRFCSQIHAFEPFSGVSEVFSQRLKENNIKNVVLHKIGLGDKNEVLDFMSPPPDNLGMGCFLKEKLNTPWPQEKQMLMQADDYIATLGLKRIDLVKIDVEGFEKYLLIGLQETLKKYRPKIIMEYSPDTRKKFSDINEFSSLLKGYKIYEIAWDRGAFFIFNNWRHCLRKFAFDRPAYIFCEPA